MSFLANLPDYVLGGMVDRRILLASLSTLVVVAMFRYLQVLLLLTISILAIGANIPSELASELGISQGALIISLGMLIAITLLNRVARLLPTDKTAPATEFIDGRQAMLDAIAKGDQATVRSLLAMNVSVNFVQQDTTPLHLAAAKGYPDIVKFLIEHGADCHVRDANGLTPLEIALAQKKFPRTTEILYQHEKSFMRHS
ncbi:hypothetical protein UT5_19440 [Ferrigenium sp. UT5]